jgi:hypothetical protein
VQAAFDLAQAYIKLNGASSPSNYQDYFKFMSLQKQLFLKELQKNQTKLNDAIFDRIEGDLKLTESNDLLTIVEWIRPALLAKYAAINERTKDIIYTNGSIHIVVPIFQALNAVDHDLAEKYFNEKK